MAKTGDCLNPIFGCAACGLTMADTAGNHQLLCSWSQTLVQQGVIEKFVALDFSDADAAFDKCMEAIKYAFAFDKPSCVDIQTRCCESSPVLSRSDWSSLRWGI